MNVKIQGGGKNAGVYANTGSAAALVEYLCHEDKERLAEGLDILPFFNGQGIDVHRGEVLQKLDRNHRKLHLDEAKFYHLDINPSKEELRAMGATEEEIVANCKVLAVKLTQLYADNFNKDIVVGKDENGNNITRRLSGEDIMIFWKVHTTRNEKEGLQVHIHGIPSRKDIHNKYQLSPVTVHRNTSKGPVTGGFERTKFYSDVERVFDETFSYARAAEETFTYCNERKKAERRERKIEANIEEIKKEKRDDLVIALPQQDNKIKDALARRELRRRNEFWNEYHSKYRPEYIRLKGACDKSFELYKTAKEKYGLCSAEITEKYNTLRDVYGRMSALQDDVQKASTAKGIVKAVSALVFFINPVAGIIMGLVGRTIAEAERSAAIAARKELRARAAVIRDSIEELKTEQAALRQDKTDKLKVYVENKEAKVVLQSEINKLKSVLDKKLEEPRILEGIAEKSTKHMAEQEPSTTRQSSDVSSFLAKCLCEDEILDVFVAAAQQMSTPTTTVSHSSNVVKSESRFDLYLLVLAAKDKYSLERNLLSKLTVMDPMKDSFGGVVDFKISFAREGRVIKASNLVSEEQLHQILDKWEAWTGEKPAFRLEIERANQRKLEDICRTIDAVSPQLGPRIPKSISFLPGNEMQISYATRTGETQTLKVDASGVIRFKDALLNVNTGKVVRIQEQNRTEQIRGSGIKIKR